MPRKIETEQDREIARAYGRWWYHQHSKQEQARSAKKKQKMHQWYEEYKATLACQRCGENHPATLVFHHRDAKEKEFAIGQAVHDGWSIKRILKEMEKCDVLCTNCHKRLHGNPWSESAS